MDTIIYRLIEFEFHMLAALINQTAVDDHACSVSTTLMLKLFYRNSNSVQNPNQFHHPTERTICNVSENVAENLELSIRQRSQYLYFSHDSLWRIKFR